MATATAPTTDPADGGASVIAEETTPAVEQDTPDKPATLLTAEEPMADAEPPKAEVTYEVTKPDGSLLDDDALTSVTSLAKQAGITDSKTVQQFIEAMDAEVRDAVEATKSAFDKGGTLWTETVKGWEQEALVDPTLGNGSRETLLAKVGQAKQAVSKFAPEGFGEFLETSGLGSHPAFLAFAVRVAQAMGEDKLVTGEPPKAKPKTLAQRIYPNLPSVEG